MISFDGRAELTADNLTIHKILSMYHPLIGDGAAWDLQQPLYNHIVIKLKMYE